MKKKHDPLLVKIQMPWSIYKAGLQSACNLTTDGTAAEAQAQMQVIGMIQVKTTFHANTSTGKIIQVFHHFVEHFKREVIWIVGQI